MGEILLSPRQRENADLAEGTLQQEGECRVSIMIPFCWRAQQLEPMWEHFAAEQWSFVP